MAEPADPKAILAARLASGQIDEEEYSRLLVGMEGNPYAVTPPPAETGDATQPPPLPDEPALPPKPPRPSLFLVRLWRGQVSLPVTYWLWGGLGGVVVIFIVSIFAEVAASPGEVLFILILAFVWQVFISTAIFRSAGNYKRRHPKRYWGHVAQVVACLALLATAGNISKALPGNEDFSELDKSLAQTNRAGPHMVADNLRFEKVVREGRSVAYAVTVTGSMKTGPEEIAARRNSAIQVLCKDRETQRLFRMVNKVTYRYADAAGKPLMAYDVAGSDCGL